MSFSQRFSRLIIRYLRYLSSYKDKYAALNKAVDDYLSSFEALKKTTD